MANYALTTTQSESKSYSEVAAALEAAAEAVVNTKVIHLLSIVHRSTTDTFVGTLVMDT